MSRLLYVEMEGKGGRGRLLRWLNAGLPWAMDWVKGVYLGMWKLGKGSGGF